MNDQREIARLNDIFIDACRDGSWEKLHPILSTSFAYVDGETGELWAHETYVASIASDRNPLLSIDQVVIRVSGDTACVSARTSSGTGRHNRYLDVYARESVGWRCIQASVWSVAADAATGHDLVSAGDGK